MIIIWIINKALFDEGILGGRKIRGGIGAMRVREVRFQRKVLIKIKGKR